MLSRAAPSAFAVALAGCLVLTAGMGIARFAYTPLLPRMQAAFGWTVAQAGDVASANFAGYVLGALLAAGFAQRPDRDRWLLAGLLASAVTTAAGAFVVSWPGWLALRFVAGLCSAICLVVGSAMVMAHVAARDRTDLGALHFAGVGVGIVVSVGVIELAKLATFTVHGQWGALGLAAALLALAAWTTLRHVSAGPGTAAEVAARAPLPPKLRMLVVAYGLFGFGYVVTATFIVAMARRLDTGALLEPFTWAVVGLAAAPSVYAWQRVERRLGMLRTLRLAYAIEALGVLVAGAAASPRGVILGGALLGVTFMGITALGLRAAREAAGPQGNRILGLMSAAFGFGQLLGPAISGRLAQASGGFLLPSAFAALLLGVGLVLLRGD